MSACAFLCLKISIPFNFLPVLSLLPCFILPSLSHGSLSWIISPLCSLSTLFYSCHCTCQHHIVLNCRPGLLATTASLWRRNPANPQTQLSSLLCNFASVPKKWSSCILKPDGSFLMLSFRMSFCQWYVFGTKGE